MVAVHIIARTSMHETKKPAATACMRKLLTILSAVVKRRTLWCEGMECSRCGGVGEPGRDDDRRFYADCVRRIFMMNWNMPSSILDSAVSC